MHKAERISRSGPKLSDAQTRNFEAIKYIKRAPARRAGAPRRLALPHRYARDGEARVLPPLRRVQGLRGHARGIRQRRRGVHAQRDAGRARDLTGRVGQHGVCPQRPRPAQGDARRPLGRGPATHRQGNFAGLALPAHDRRRARPYVRALGRRRGLPLLERELPGAQADGTPGRRRRSSTCRDGRRREHGPGGRSRRAAAARSRESAPTSGRGAGTPRRPRRSRA